MRRLSGFSLMEMMIVLLIVAIIAAASAPMVSKKMANDLGADGSDCGWIALGNDTFFNGFKDKGKRSAIIGAQTVDGATGISKDKPRLYIETDDIKKNPHIQLRVDSNIGKKANIGITDGGDYWFSSANIYNAEGMSTAFGQDSSAVYHAVAVGYNATATGQEGVAIGPETSAKLSAIAIGHGAAANNSSIIMGALVDSANATSAIGIGEASKVASNSIAIGQEATASDVGAVAIGSKFSEGNGAFKGNSADAKLGAVAIGADTIASTNAVAIGLGATGSQVHSVAIGWTTSADNQAVAVGSAAKACNKYSIALGAQVTAGAENAIAIGGNAYNTAGVAIGKNASVGTNNTNAGYAVAMGYNSHAYGQRSIAIGGSSISASDNASNTAAFATSDDSIAIGTARATSTQAIAIGAGSIASGDSSIAIGPMNKNNSNMSTSASNTQAIAIGAGSLASGLRSFAAGNFASAKGDDSMAIGDEAQTTASASNSVAIGPSAIAQNSDSVVISNSLSGASTAASNQIVLGNAGTTVYIPGNLVVDKVSVLGRKEGAEGRVWAAILPATKSNSRLTMLRSDEQNYEQDGIIKMYKTTNADSTIFTETNYGIKVINNCDRRLKNVGEVFKGGLEEIKKLEVFNYVYKKDTTKTPRVGVMAQDLQKIFPNAVMKGDDGFLRIRMEDMFYALVNAVKELDRKIDLLIEKQKKIDELEKRVDTLEKRLAKLEKQMKEK